MKISRGGLVEFCYCLCFEAHSLRLAPDLRELFFLLCGCVGFLGETKRRSASEALLGGCPLHEKHRARTTSRFPRDFNPTQASLYRS